MGRAGSMRCDAIDRGACAAHAYRAETGSLGNVIHEPPADWQPGRAGQDQLWGPHWPQWGPVNLTPPEAVPHGSDSSCSRCEPPVSKANAEVDHCYGIYREERFLFVSAYNPASSVRGYNTIRQYTTYYPMNVIYVATVPKRCSGPFFTFTPYMM